MNRFFSILLYDLAFIAIALFAVFLVIVLWQVLKKQFFNKWAYNKRDVPLTFNQVRIRRFVGAIEIYSTIIPAIAILCVFISVLHYTYLPFLALFFYVIALSSIAGSYNFGSLYTSKIESSISSCCLFLRPFELEQLSISNANKTKSRIYQDISGKLCGYLSAHVAQVYSIGNPNGMVDNILHSVSIYASDENWKKTVASLAEKAQVIVVHVGDTNGCIWELEHCSEQCLFDKVIFIVDSPDKLEFLRKLDVLAEVILPDKFSGISMLVYKDLNEGTWCCKEVTDIQKSDEIELIVRDYFSSRESMRVKRLLSDSNPINSITENQEKVENNVLSTSRIDKAWIHRLSFVFGPFGYCSANKWSELPTERLLISFGLPYLILLTVGIIGLGEIWCIIAYAVFITVLGYWVVICPNITANENRNCADTMSTLLNINLLKKTMFTFVVSYLILALFTGLHTFGLRLFGI